MATVILSHKVKDFDTWLPGYESDKERRVALGLNNVKLMREMNDPNNVFLLFEMDDPSKLETMFSDPELMKLMEKLGVISKPEVIILTEA